MNQEQYETIYNHALALQFAARQECGSFIQELVDDMVNMLRNAKPQEE